MGVLSNAGSFDGCRPGVLAIRVLESIGVGMPLFLPRFPPTRGVGNNGKCVRGVLGPCVVSMGCNANCILGSADMADGVRYKTDSPMVKSGS